MKKLIFAVLNYKGGVGKSIISEHFILAYLLRKSEEKKVKIYEFDAHNFSFDRIKKDPYVVGEKIGSGEEVIETALANIEWEAEEGTPIILDIGGSDNIDRFLTSIEGKAFAKEIVFIVPENKEKPNGSLDTIFEIETKIPDAKIMLALNRCINDEEKEKEFLFIYGSKMFNIASSQILKEENIRIVTIPECETVLSLCGIDNISLYTKAKEWEEMKDLGVSEKKTAWGALESKETNEELESCSKEFFVKKSSELRASQVAHTTIGRAAKFFMALDEMQQ